MKHITTIEIPKLEGKKVISESKIFDYIDSDFKNWGANKKGEETSAMNLNVFEMDTNAKFSQMMSPENLLTQEQILYVVENHKDVLQTEGYATFFPFKSGSDIFVACVDVDDGRLRASVYRFSYDSVWFAKYRRRVVVPQVATTSLSPSEPLAPSILVPSEKTVLQQFADFISKLPRDQKFEVMESENVLVINRVKN